MKSCVDSVDPLCRVSCSPTAAGSTLNPDYTSETPENNISKTQKEKVASFWMFFFQKKKKKKEKTQTAVRRSCRRKTLREVGESLRSDSQEHGGGGRGGAGTPPQEQPQSRGLWGHITGRLGPGYEQSFFLWFEERTAFYNLPPPP